MHCGVDAQLRDRHHSKIVTSYVTVHGAPWGLVTEIANESLWPPWPGASTLALIFFHHRKNIACLARDNSCPTREETPLYRGFQKDRSAEETNETAAPPEPRRLPARLGGRCGFGRHDHRDGHWA